MVHWLRHVDTCGPPVTPSWKVQLFVSGSGGHEMTND